ncbi:TonB-dependent receptor [Mucilaginibacter jinjuensis]|uniref:TonB-dependent receptor n=1 Tax=Mucilaginibacter jinjuensis TaxID=1176721 RepID=A0ABY7T2M8_9SPHI|nr:TonB-dependent receptor [Mucilaginibacter jinjuensis]WCT10504.1 TonB-dependent receptor [Mucilaginibacter jinjuensis]
MRKILLLLFATVFSLGITYAQGNGGKLITGKLLDSQTKEPLIGATVTIKGTTKAVSVSLDGTFKIRVPEEGTTTLVFSYIGYISKTLDVADKNLGTITLDPTTSSVKEVVVNASSPIAVNRSTPIAASSVNQVYIEEKGAGAEFPELLKSTPGVMTSRTGGGYGDSRINIRGFSSNNVALLINGIPANDVEAGKLYWNDWAGLQDVTTFMQVQRGLSATDIAVPSLGGTINILTRNTEKDPGGTISQSVGSFNSFKTVLSYATGLNDKGWASSFLLSRTSGDGYAQGLYYTGYNYFANISKVWKNQTLSFNIMGAAQSHGQRYTFNTISTYRAAPDGTQYNSDFGIYNGKVYSAEQNFYNKPLASLNHNWTIDSKTSLSTILYGTYGYGAADYLSAAPGVSGTTPQGYVTLTPGSPTGVPRTGGTYSPIDFNSIIQTNVNNPDGSSTRIMQNVVNKHVQGGLISTFKKVFGDFHTLGGLDLRYYTGEHYNTVADLLGGDYITDARVNSATSPTGNINNPNAHVVTGQRFNNDYRYDVGSEGVYLQTEYIKNDLSAFVSLAGNYTNNRRTDYFNYTPGNQNSPWVNFWGYQAKGGVNYNIDAHSNVYVNGGYIQRSPLVAAIFLNKQNEVNANAKPEKLLDYEVGYGYQSGIFTAKVDAFRSTYRDRTVVRSTGAVDTDGTPIVVNISGLNEVHQGFEFEGKLRPVKDITFTGSLTIADYHYLTNTGPAQTTSSTGTTVTQSSLLLKGLKVGEFGSAPTSAQTTAALGVDVQVLPAVKIGANWNYYARYYATFDPTKLTSTGYTNYEVPNYSICDLNIVYRFKFAGLDASFVGNVYNLFNTEYLSDAYELNPPLTPAGQNFATRTNALGVWYGAPRMYMTTLKVKF